MNEPVLIKTWEELKDLKSDTHYLDIDLNMCNGWILPRYEKQDYENSFYLSTHTFYGSMHEISTKTLQSYGFNVVIDNWDKDIDK